MALFFIFSAGVARLPAEPVSEALHENVRNFAVNAEWESQLAFRRKS
jgi:hypothetical protein